tara:strand:+ start:273 stop:1061 length:789 start_codon:yes stop_codon:yes gene_type:complete
MDVMKIVSWNVNGIRACANKGAFTEYLDTHDPDILLLQETKAMPEQIPDHILNPSGYYGAWHSAEKKGYSGVAILTKEKPIMVHEGLGIPKYDCEGRVIIAQYPSFFLVNAYFPNGQRDSERLQYKLDFYQDIFDYCQDLVQDGHNVIIAGDFNTAHQEIDLARPKENQGTSGFLPIEREWMDRIIHTYQFCDTFRHFDTRDSQYSWWSYRAGARRKNVGWRIDYVFVNQGMIDHVKEAFIHQSSMGSDHCPVGVVIEPKDH